MAVHSPEFKRENFNINCISVILDEITGILQYILSSLQTGVVTLVSDNDVFIQSACEQFRKRFDSSLQGVNYTISSAAKILLEYLNFLHMKTHQNLCISKHDLHIIYHNLVHIFIPIIPNTAKCLAKVAFDINIEKELYSHDIVNIKSTLSFDPQYVLAALRQK